MNKPRQYSMYASCNLCFQLNRWNEIDFGMKIKNRNVPRKICLSKVLGSFGIFWAELKPNTYSQGQSTL